MAVRTVYSQVLIVIMAYLKLMVKDLIDTTKDRDTIQHLHMVIKALDLPTPNHLLVMRIPAINLVNTPRTLAVTFSRSGTIYKDRNTSCVGGGRISQSQVII